MESTACAMRRAARCSPTWLIDPSAANVTSTATMPPGVPMRRLRLFSGLSAPPSTSATVPPGVAAAAATATADVRPIAGCGAFIESMRTAMS